MENLAVRICQQVFNGKKAGEYVDFDLRKAYPSDVELSSLLRIDKELVSNVTGLFRIEIAEVLAFKKHEVNQELFDKVYEQVDEKLISLNKGVGIGVNHGVSTGVNHGVGMVVNRGVQSNQIYLSPDEEKLFMKLRRARMEVALKEGFPPYVVFHDSVLRQIAKQKPDTPESLRIIIGDKKFERYGDLILNSQK